jgi:hypothetical protein
MLKKLARTTASNSSKNSKINWFQCLNLNHTASAIISVDPSITRYYLAEINVKSNEKTLKKIKTEIKPDIDWSKTQWYAK